MYSKKISLSLYGNRDPRVEDDSKLGCVGVAHDSYSLEVSHGLLIKLHFFSVDKHIHHSSTIQMYLFGEERHVKFLKTSSPCVRPPVCLSVSQSVSQSINQYVCLLVSLLICMPVCLFAEVLSNGPTLFVFQWLAVCLLTCLFVCCLPACPLARLPACPLARLPACLLPCLLCESVCQLSACLFLSLFLCQFVSCMSVCLPLNPSPFYLHYIRAVFLGHKCRVDSGSRHPRVSVC